MPRILLIALCLAAPALAQTTFPYPNTPTVSFGSIITPEIQLGSATRPSIITVPPTIEVTGTRQPQPSNVEPASTELLSMRHFDFVTSPLDSRPGSMADASFSLGDYARQLRAEREQNKARRNAMQQEEAPGSMAQPDTK